MGKYGLACIVVTGVFIAYVDILNVWRIAVFLVTHNHISTKDGHLEAAKAFNHKDLDTELWGFSFLVTGANSGIGKSTAMALARRGGKVHMVCRNLERCEEAKKYILSKIKNQDVHVHIVDMSDIASVHRFAYEFAVRHRKLDVLINNAAVMSHERTLTGEDLELNFATNTMGYFSLTTAFLPLLEKSVDPRVVMVSSGGLLMASLRVHDLQHENCTFYGDRSYNEQKRHQLVMAEELATLHPNIHFSVMDPGWVDTPALKKSLPGFYNKYKDKLRSPEQGSDTAVWLASSESALLYDSGLFFMDRTPVPTHLPFTFTRESISDRVKLMKALHEISERLKPDDVPHQFFKDN